MVSVKSDAPLRRIRARQSLGRISRVCRSYRKLRDTLDVAANHDASSPIIVEWAHRGLVAENWGDKLNPVLVQLVSGRRAVPRAEVLNIAGRPVHYVIGSGLGGVRDPKAVIWGTGFLRYDQTPLVQPMHIAAVRGPLSRQKYLAAGIDCPELYGDAALLYPLYYKPALPKTYRLGVIAHYREQHLPAFQQLADQAGVKMINILGGIQEVIDDIVSCEVVASSSLHGLIASDAYGVPSVWLRASELPMGDYFKFRDYLMSAGRSQLDPLLLDRHFGAQELVDLGEIATVQPDLERLLDVCPFRQSA